MSQNLWTSAEIAAATGGRAGAGFAASGVSIDSRRIARGDLFVALQGPNFDGHDYIAGALSAGAAGILAHRLPAGIAADAPVVLVGDTLIGLQDLGRVARDRSPARFIAVTGSVGKTSTKEMLKQVLGAQAATFASEGNLNNHWGAPLSLARMPRDAAIGIFELGMNHAGEIRPLAKMVRPHAAIITAVEAVHIEFFNSVDEIADAKAEILEGMEPGGTAILPRDNPHFARLRDRAKALGIAHIVTFGAAAESDCRLLDCVVGEDGNRVTASIGGRELAFSMGLAGRHQALNALAVLAGVAALDGDVARAARDLGATRALKGRGQRETIALAGGTLLLLDESYNASPAAMRAAFTVLGGIRPGAGGRRIAIIGDMRELGAQGPALHRDLCDAIVAAGIERVFCVGALMGDLFQILPASLRGHHSVDSLAMVAPAIAALRAGDVVLVKGSLGTRMAPIVDAIRAMDSNATQPRQAANGH
ncbi:UDP-N-acetylmuramoyl-tripeptide--D-alanyl-D-alanine ligase [Dongia mobilis]|uniref:UDP-N-acetylmuramoyl-tripeptide--D-alanyl-D-alanine ligase n=1 Tax=Dongia mobilis TaxID=578943 RepID=A0A4R6WUX0_9PROT|nr:UDP-N-acetylmuramoylalanyl-D-glutamyl-2,6-diaminopimelate--D-alanyl-D-alanine ligase [Dongia mobilis]TDQ83960.1 UDP-N-acetylmuramoyl-tripeptide--D-alanyl-D-alanine ligase [Dongia mobilis]